MAFIGSIEDKLGVRELYDTLADGSCRGDAETFLSCWTDDAVWNTDLFTRTGKAELREQWDQLWLGFDKVGLIATVLSIEVAGDTAQARALASESILLKGGGVYKLQGYYTDRLVRAGDRWLFAQRDYTRLIEELPG